MSLSEVSRKKLKSRENCWLSPQNSKLIRNVCERLPEAVAGPAVTRPESLVYHAHQNWYCAHWMGRQSAHLGNPVAPGTMLVPCAGSLRMPMVDGDFGCRCLRNTFVGATWI
jgi:hypothetical protein